MRDDCKPDYTCTDCGIDVFNIGPPPDAEPVCNMCRFIRAHPDMPDHIKRHLRGDTTEAFDINGGGTKH